MLDGVAAEIVAFVLLLGVLVFAMTTPRGLPEAVVAVPAAGLVLLLGLVDVGEAADRVTHMLPTIAFLAAILLLAHLADAEGVFTWLGSRLARASGGEPRRLFGLVFVAAAATTAVLSLDATVVLLTPIVLFTARRLRLPPRPHLYACAHLSNSASLLLPVSNLTNLLAFAASGLTFLGFSALMLLPWLAAIACEYVVFRLFFARDLAAPAVEHTDDDLPTPTFALGLLAAVLVGFGTSSGFGVEPVWIAAAGALVLGARALLRREITAWRLVKETAPLFCLFVLALAVVVQAVAGGFLGDVLARALPDDAMGLLALLVAAGVAALLANLVNNLPATMVLLSALGTSADPGLVLAVLLGVNIGPNATYLGSLATLLWRRVLARRDVAVPLGEFTVLGALTTPLTLVVAVLALWGALRVPHVR